VKAVRRLARRQVLAPVFAALLAAGALYEAAVALKWIPLGSLPGEGPAGEGFLLGPASLAMLVGVVAYGRPGLDGRYFVWAEALIPVAAAGLVTAQFYTFDPYFLPSLLRHSERGWVPSAWIFVLLGCGFVVGTSIVLRPRIGLRLLSILLLLCFGTLFYGQGGH
jgi:hypothetical protein